MPCRGEVRVRDARVAMGAGFLVAPWVDLLVLARDGGTPVACRVDLVELVSGPRTHRVFACPACRSAVRLLIARRGRLRCRACDRTRTRRQLERTRADWRRLGGSDEDALLRLLSAPRSSDAKRAEAARLAERITDADARALQRIESELATLERDVFTLRVLRALNDVHDERDGGEPAEETLAPEGPGVHRQQGLSHLGVRGEAG